MENYIENDELNRILDLPNANRFPTEKDIVFLKAHIADLSEDQIRQFKLAETPASEIKPEKAVVAKKVGKVSPEVKKTPTKAIKLGTKKVRLVLNVKIPKKPTFKLVKKTKKAKK